MRGTQKPVAFTWQSDDSNSGDITATFGTGRVFKGEYFQISRDIRVEEPRSALGWLGPAAQQERLALLECGFAFRVRARKQRPRAREPACRTDGEYMRCRFTLISPERGMKGGGEGRCQLSDSGKEINAEFDRQS